MYILNITYYYANVYPHDIYKSICVVRYFILKLHIIINYNIVYKISSHTYTCLRQCTRPKKLHTGQETNHNED